VACRTGEILGMSEPAVGDWRGVRTAFPEMTLSAAAAPEVVLPALRRALRRQWFLVRDQPDGSLKARHVDPLDAVAGSLGWTTLVVVAQPSETGSLVRISVHSWAGSARPAGRRASRALSAAVLALRGQGVAVTTTDWVVPVHRRKGKRR
jgi:hypothetical protein